MAILDEQITRLGTVADKMVSDIDTLLTGKIQEVRELLNGITITTSVKATEVEPAQPAQGA